MKNATLIFLLRGSEILLGMKKRGFGEGKWNGFGGKVSDGESIEDAARREIKEECGVDVSEMEKLAVLDFIFSKKSEWNQRVHVFFTHEWIGEPSESEEMSPKWFLKSELPFEKMWPDDKIWLPEVLNGGKLQAEFVFGEGDTIISHNMKSIA